jgi:HlyD family secretion protein
MFRKAALAKLASPEQLDSLMQVTTPKGWLALIALLIVIGAGLAWGVLGRTSERVSGAGILLPEGGLFGIETRGDGTVQEVLVKVGDVVSKGQVVMRVAQAAQAEEIRQVRAQIEDLLRNRDRSVQLIVRNRDAELRYLLQERQRLDKSTEALRNQLQFLENRLAAQTEAVRRGLITDDVRQATAQELESIRGQLIAGQAQVVQMDGREASTRNQADQGIFSLDQEVRRTQRQLEMTLLRYDEGTQVLSPYDGKVMSRLVDEGQEVRASMTVLYIELTNQPLQAVAFIPMQGARLKPGQVAQMSPEGITWEEYGYLLGDVVTVAQGPSNPDAMTRVLRNQTLVQQFTASGTVYELRIKPRTDPGTPSGFAWTSRQGPPLRFGSGTLLRVQIPVQERRPIELVIPTVRRWFGL